MPSPFKPLEWIYSIEELEFTVDGKEYPVSRVSFTAFDNGIPTINVQIAPVESPDDYIQAITLPKLIEYQNELQKSAGVDGIPTKLKFKLVSEKDVQELELEDWYIDSVGLEPVQVSGASVAASVVLSHPLRKASKASLTLYNYTADIKQPEAPDDTDNVLEAYIRAVEEYVWQIEGGSTTFSEKNYGTGSDSDDYGKLPDNIDVEQLNEASIERFKKALQALNVNTVWKEDPLYDGFPYIEQGPSDIVERIQLGIWDYSQLEGRNPLSGLSYIMSDFLLCQSGTFTNKPIHIKPYAPWGAPEGFITDDEISAITLPPSSESISGTLCKFSMGKQVEFGYLPPGYVENVKGGSDVDPVNNNQVGGFLKYVNQLLGVVKVISPPSWMTAIVKRQSNTNCEYGTDNINDENNITNVGDEAFAEDYTTGAEEFFNMAVTYAEDMFYQYFRAESQISFNTRFMLYNKNFNIEDNILRPGIVATIRSIDSNFELLYFYINRVEHIIDAQRGSAYSRFTGGYVRPASGIQGKTEPVLTPTQIAEGIPNKSYLKDAGSEYKPPGYAGDE